MKIKILSEKCGAHEDMDLLLDEDTGKKWCPKCVQLGMPYLYLPAKEPKKLTPIQKWHPSPECPCKRCDNKDW